MIRPGDTISWRHGAQRRRYGTVYVAIKQSGKVIGYRAFDERGNPVVLLAYQVTKECG